MLMPIQRETISYVSNACHRLVNWTPGIGPNQSGTNSKEIWNRAWQKIELFIQKHQKAFENGCHFAAYMRQWMSSILVQIMACRLFGTKPLSKPMLGNCQLDPWQQTSVNFNQNKKTRFVHENASENIACEVAVIHKRLKINIILS